MREYCQYQLIYLKDFSLMYNLISQKREILTEFFIIFPFLGRLNNSILIRFYIFL